MCPFDVGVPAVLTRVVAVYVPACITNSKVLSSPVKCGNFYKLIHPISSVFLAKDSGPKVWCAMVSYKTLGNMNQKYYVT